MWNVDWKCNEAAKQGNIMLGGINRGIKLWCQGFAGGRVTPLTPLLAKISEIGIIVQFN